MFIEIVGYGVPFELTMFDYFFGRFKVGRVHRVPERRECEGNETHLKFFLLYVFCRSMSSK